MLDTRTALHQLVYRGLLELRAAVYADLMVSVLVSLSLVGDSHNHVLRMIDARTDTITTIAGGISGTRHFAFSAIPSHPFARWNASRTCRGTRTSHSTSRTGPGHLSDASGQVLARPPVEHSKGAKGVPS